ncbi:hypothetical protein CANCADRAFT_32449, partial [Tortispora caseinolytica NRRL Y-17796]
MKNIIPLIAVSAAISIDRVTTISPDISKTGQLSIFGDFLGFSPFTYLQQSSQPSGAQIFQSDGTSIPLFSNHSELDVNGLIYSSCLHDNVSYVGGDFQSPYPYIFAINLTDGSTFPLSQIEGPVYSLLCTSDSLYAGGNFDFNQTHGAAVYDFSSLMWSSLPFGGFSAGSEVNALAQRQNGNIIFGGNFTSLGNQYYLGNTSESMDNYSTTQYIALASGNASASGPSSSDPFDPSAPLCGLFESAEASTWRLADNSLGSWQIYLPRTINPYKVQLRNTPAPNSGTSQFRFVSFPTGGIMNLSYVDTDGIVSYCDAFCALQPGADQFQEFSFVNIIGMTGFKIEILGMYGDYAGLSGIALVDNYTAVYAINSYNSINPCDGEGGLGVSKSSTTGSGWSIAEDLGYLTNTINSAPLSDYSVTFYPNISVPGNYSVYLHTPGCIGDNTCSSRGVVDVFINASQDVTQSHSIYQTNNYEKYDTVYNGFIDSSSNFSPSIRLTPRENSALPFTFVADKITVILESAIFNTSEKLEVNAVLEYDPSNFTSVNSTPIGIGNDTLTSIGDVLGSEAEVQAIETLSDGSVLVGGKFDNCDISQVLISIAKDNSVSAFGSNNWEGSIYSLYNSQSGQLFIGGDMIINQKPAFFTSLNISNNALIETSTPNGPVILISQFSLKNYTGESHSVILVAGDFDELLDSNSSINYSVPGSGLYFESSDNWYQEIAGNSFPLLLGDIQNALTVNEESEQYVLLGSGISSESFKSISLALTDGNSVFEPNKLITFASEESAVRTVLYPDTGNDSFVIVGGNFRMNSSKTSQFENIMLIIDDSVIGISDGMDSASTVLALAAYNDTLFAGGRITGSSNSNELGNFVSLDLATGEYTQYQPAPLTCSSQVCQVNDIVVYSERSLLFVAGSFEKAGQLSCSGICSYETGPQRWQGVAGGVEGNVTSLLLNGERLYFSGEFQLDGKTGYLAYYDLRNNSIQSFDESELTYGLPGKVNGFLSPSGDIESSVIVWGQESRDNNKFFISVWNNNQWGSIDGLAEDSQIFEVLLLPVSESVSSAAYLASDEVLLAVGNIIISESDDEEVSAAYFDGDSWQPFIFTSKKNSEGEAEPGIIYGISS